MTPRLRSLLTRSELYKTDKGLRKYAATVERAIATWEVSPQEWADYIAFLGRLLKVEHFYVPSLPCALALTTSGNPSSSQRCGFAPS